MPEPYSTDAQLLLAMDPDDCGEVLRAFTFIGKGIGCYENRKVRKDAHRLSERALHNTWEGFDLGDPQYLDEVVELGRGYTFMFLGQIVWCLWYWDGDGVLAYSIQSPEGPILRRVLNGDCKKDYGWRDVR